MSKFITTLAIGTILSGASVAHADEIFLALPSQNTGDSQSIIDATRSSFEALLPNDQFSVLRVSDGTSIMSLKVPNNGRYKIAKYKEKDFAAELNTLQSFVRETNNMPVVGFADLLSDIPTTLKAIGDLRTSREDIAHILIVASPLHKVSENPSMSMQGEDGKFYFPTGGFLTGDKMLSPYGLGADNSYLKNTVTHFCPILPENMSPHQKEALAEFWAQYISLRQGVLATFTTDKNTCVARFKARVNEPLKVRELDRDMLPAMVTADMSGKVTRITITRTQDLEEQISREKRVNKERVTVLEVELEASETARKKSDTKTKKLAKELRDIRKITNARDGVSTFSQFKHIAHPTISSLTINTGVGFKGNFPKHSSAWCYFEKDNAQGASVKIQIGTQSFGKRVIWTRTNTSILAQVGLTQAEYKAARQSCRFPR